MEEKIRNAHRVAKELADETTEHNWQLVYSHVFSAMCSATLTEQDDAAKEATQT